jgi:hypothetical protein
MNRLQTQIRMSRLMLCVAQNLPKVNEVKENRRIMGIISQMDADFNHLSEKISKLLTTFQVCDRQCV